MLTHVVLFKLKNPAKETLIEVKERLMSLDGQVSELKHIEVGIDVLRSPRSYDISLVTRFATLEDMQSYQVHPAHVQVAEFLNSVCSSVVAVDYES